MYYIVRLNNEHMCIYYNDSGSILCKRQNKTEVSVLDDARDYFSVNIINGAVCVFCADMENVFLNTYKENRWEKKILFKNNQPLMINAISQGNDLGLLYNQNGCLVVHNLTTNAVHRIDDSINKQIYSVQNITPEHIVAFYTKSKTNLGYRELKLDKKSDFNVIHSTGYKIIDTSFIITNDSIHFVYVIKNMFTSQLIYRKKDDKGFDKSQIIFEAQDLTDCLVFEIQGEINITWLTNNNLYIYHSKKVSRYKNKFCLEPIKAVYLTNDNDKAFYCHEVYVDKLNPLDVQLLPDMYENFAKPVVIDKPNENEILQSKLDMAYKKLSEKDNQIDYLTKLLKAKNEEILSLYNKAKD